MRGAGRGSQWERVLKVSFPLHLQVLFLNSFPPPLYACCVGIASLVHREIVHISRASTIVLCCELDSTRLVPRHLGYLDHLRRGSVSRLMIRIAWLVDLVGWLLPWESWDLSSIVLLQVRMWVGLPCPFFNLFPFWFLFLHGSLLPARAGCHVLGLCGCWRGDLSMHDSPSFSLYAI